MTTENLAHFVPNAVAEATVFSELITKSQLQTSLPSLKSFQIDDLHGPLNSTLAKYSINTKLDIAAFIATCGHECLDFTILSENLNYSKDALLRTFKKYFPNDATAAQYARNPKAIANRVYANRMGNGAEKSGDGYLFRGAGAIQLTGRKNIGAFALSAGMSILDATVYLRTLPGALQGAGWFWAVNALSKYGDAGQFQALQGLVNVGRANATPAQIHGWNDRVARYSRAKKALGV